MEAPSEGGRALETLMQTHWATTEKQWLCGNGDGEVLLAGYVVNMPFHSVISTNVGFFLLLRHILCALLLLLHSAHTHLQQRGAVVGRSQPCRCSCPCRIV